jgi:hypothetical protein
VNASPRSGLTPSPLVVWMHSDTAEPAGAPDDALQSHGERERRNPSARRNAQAVAPGETSLLSCHGNASSSPSLRGSPSGLIGLSPPLLATAGWAGGALPSPSMAGGGTVRRSAYTALSGIARDLLVQPWRVGRNPRSLRLHAGVSLSDRRRVFDSSACRGFRGTLVTDTSHRPPARIIHSTNSPLQSSARIASQARSLTAFAAVGLYQWPHS